MPKSIDETLKLATEIANDHSARGVLVKASEMLIREETWNFFATFTFRGDVDESDAAQEFEERYVHRLQQRSQGRVAYFGAAAKNTMFGRVHVHAVLRLARPATIAACQSAWLAGLSKVGQYDENRGGRWYIARHVALPDAELLFRR